MRIGRPDPSAESSIFRAVQTKAHLFCTITATEVTDEKQNKITIPLKRSPRGFYDTEEHGDNWFERYCELVGKAYRHESRRKRRSRMIMMLTRFFNGTGELAPLRAQVVSGMLVFGQQMADLINFGRFEKRWCSSCTDNTSAHARAQAHFSQCALFLRASKVILSSVVSLLNTPSNPFPHIFSSPTTSPTPPTTSPTPLTGIRLTPCAASLGDGLPGHLAGPIPNTSEPKFCIDVSSENTPINFPSRKTASTLGLT